jgi:acetaldehyde dehydrogenase
LELGYVIDIHEGDGLNLARKMGIEGTPNGIESFKDPKGCQIAFDCTTADSHPKNYEIMQKHSITTIDLTPAAIGPFVVPSVNLKDHLDKDNVNLITCGGQATIPMMYAVSRITPVKYGEIVATVASKSAGMGTRTNIDEFTVTTRRGIELVGGAQEAKAIVILNPAEPPITMRNTIYSLCEDVNADRDAITESVNAMEKQVQSYVPGYKKILGPLFEVFETKWYGKTLKIEIKIEVEGAGDYLPKYSGNLDLQNSAAVAIAEQFVKKWDTKN